MPAYEALAASYDRLTADVDYPGIVSFYCRILAREGLRPRTAADLACGTGSVTALLAQAGLEVTGVDLSEEMLSQAEQKCRGLSPRPRFLRQDLSRLRLDRGVDLAVCALDSLDYITSPAACRAAMARVYRCLNPGGIFLFDVNTPEKLKAMDGQIFLDEDDDVYCVWRGAFDGRTQVCSYGMDLFQRRGNIWLRSFEEHNERAHTPAELIAWLHEAGFTGVESFGDRVLEAPGAGEQRIFFKARKGRVRWKTAL